MPPPRAQRSNTRGRGCGYGLSSPPRPCRGAIRCKTALTTGSAASSIDLLAIAGRMVTVREHLGSRRGIIPPQYSLLMAVGRFRRKRGVGVTAVAPLLHVSSAFVATETGKLQKPSDARQTQRHGPPVLRTGALGRKSGLHHRTLQPRNSGDQRYIFWCPHPIQLCGRIRADGGASARLGAGNGASARFRPGVLARVRGVACSF